MNNYSPTKELYYDSLRDNLSEIQIKTLIEQGHRYAWLGYVLLVLLVFLRVSITSAIIYTATTLADMKVRFKDLFSIALKADFIFIIPLVIQVIWINVTPKQLTLEDVQYFAPLSLLNLVNPKGIDALWIYPFQTLSVFEVAYWIALAYGLKQLLNNSLDESFSLVIKSYLPALLLWVAFVMFLTVTISPA
ncbi:hypothetical protein ORI89_09400 [Sphingobacterium sp. UT-1RO-CII-1]|uniref:hypothetical protein n=1 Tax=Sphingobacterium sp. UT-1RO-CII-1 TaxID=2995225 RepID=UPI00227C4902|nr:hypothetical protein [Sphingobacterium sp. UT-1RO-CII-1]MCY4779867.1 hypothetical protein [Sphingobacterium sp. UT-1RO-CII-1]